MMAKATDKASAVTTLVIGQVEVPVALFSTVAKPAALREMFTTAGPNGGVLKAREVARPTPADDGPVDELDVPATSDPLAVGARDELTSPDPFAAQVRGHEVHEAIAGVVDGEYARELYEESTGEVVPPEKVRRGVRIPGPDGEEKFIDCTAELAKIDEDTRLERMEVLREGFVDITRVPRARVKGVSYIGSNDPRSLRSLRLIYLGLKAARRGAVVKLTKRSRQSLGMIGWHGDHLVLYELVWSEDFREAPERARIDEGTLEKHGLAPIREAELAAFAELIREWSGPVEILGGLRDDAIGRREELHARALTGEITDVVDAEVVDPGDQLAAQLAASLAEVGA